MSLPEETIGSIPIGKIQPSPTNPRKTFDGLEQLADSIRELGILQDIIVRPVGGKIAFDPAKGWTCDHFEIISGERRFRASQMAGLKKLQCKVKPLTDAEVLAVQLVENDQREGVRPSEQAAAYKRFVDLVGLEQAAVQLGLSQSTVRGIMLLAKCPGPLAEALDAGTVSRSVAELVCRVPSSDLRALVAVCVLAGATHPGGMGSESPLTVRETKELISKHFTRELKLAPFSRKALDLVEGAGSCDTCPKRAGNLAKEDPEYASTRADVCTDPDCFAAKCEAYRMAERQRFAKTWQIEELDDVDVESDPFAFDRKTLTTGWLDWDAPIHEADLGKWAKKYKPGTTLGNVCSDHDVPKPRLAFDASGKPRSVVRTADVRKALLKAGVLVKAENSVKPERSAAETRSATAKPQASGAEEPVYNLYRITSSIHQIEGIEFDAKADADEEELALLAHEAIVESGFLSYGWERVPDKEADALPPKPSEPQPGPIVCRPVGELKLSEIPGITTEDYGLLVACGLPTLFALEEKCKQHFVANRRSHETHCDDVAGQVYGVLRLFPGCFNQEHVLRIGDAIIDFLGQPKAKVQTSAPPKKRKAVTS